MADAVARLFDRAMELLMRPRVRVARRWAFLVTVPVGALVATIVDVRSGVLLVAARVALSLTIALVAWRMGGERGQAVLDLVMHPRARALMRAESDMALAIPRLLARAVTRGATPALHYSRGDFTPALALALAPSVVVEGAIVHLLLPGGWVVVHVAAATLHAYMLLWLVAWGLGSRAYPHRLDSRTLEVRNGPLYRARVPLDAVVAALPCRERAGTTMGVPEGLVVRDGAALLPCRGRVDLWLELDHPVMVQRPLAEPLAVTRLALASDDPDDLARRLLAVAPAATRGGGRPAVAVAGGLELAGALRDALQPA